MSARRCCSRLVKAIRHRLQAASPEHKRLPRGAALDLTDGQLLPPLALSFCGSYSNSSDSAQAWAASAASCSLLTARHAYKTQHQRPHSVNTAAHLLALRAEQQHDHSTRNHCFSSTGVHSDEGSRTCWNCGAAVPRVSFFFCEMCNVLQPAVLSADFFLLLDVPPQFDVDLRKLEASYKQLQRRLHPDKYATASREEREFSEQQSSAVGSAYSVLADPFRRALYMLERAGAIEAGSDGQGLPLPDDPSLLTAVMEAREAIEDSADEAALTRLRADNQQQEQSILQGLSKAFRQNDLTAARELTARLRYVTRIRDAIKQRSNQHEDAA